MAEENSQQTPLGQDVGVPVERVVTELPKEEPKTEERPEGLPEGFDSWEAFGKAQLEASKEKPAEEEPKQEEPAKLAPEMQAELDKLPETTREKATPLFQEFASTGTLSPESRKAAAEAFGVTEEMVDVYVAGYAAQSDAASAPYYEAAGGKETFNEFRAWAEAGGLTPTEMAEFNTRLTSGDDADAKKVIAEAIDLWKAEGNGKPPRDITRDQPAKDSSQDASGFASKDQMIQAMRDPRYAKDAAYRAGVDAKIAKSPF